MFIKSSIIKITSSKNQDKIANTYFFPSRNQGRLSTFPIIPSKNQARQQLLEMAQSRWRQEFWHQETPYKGKHPQESCRSGFIGQTVFLLQRQSCIDPQSPNCHQQVNRSCNHCSHQQNFGYMCKIREYIPYKIYPNYGCYSIVWLFALSLIV